MSEPREIYVAIVGCGFVADYYMSTLADYPWLRIAGAFDIDTDRLDRFTAFYNLDKFESLEQLFNEERVSIVLNLTNPRAHFEISRRCLESGKHVYSEKPLGMDYSQAEELVNLAEEKRLVISSAPCSLLGRSAQTLWRVVRDRVVGNVLMVYAELDDGMIHRMPYKRWRSVSGAPWPYKDEFEVGCTLEHAGYYLHWLVAMFGPIATVTASSGCLIPEKVIGEVLEPSDTADYSVGVLVFESGVVARLSVSIVAPHDHSIRIIGENGVIGLRDCWFNDAKVTVRKLMTIRRKTFISPIPLTYKVSTAPRKKLKDTGGNRMDFAAGVAELALSVLEGRTCRLSPGFCLHVNEVALAMQYAGSGVTYHTKSRFQPVQPVEWAMN